MQVGIYAQVSTGEQQSIPMQASQQKKARLSVWTGAMATAVP